MFYFLGTPLETQQTLPIKMYTTLKHFLVKSLPRGRSGMLHTSVQLFTSVQQSTPQLCCTHLLYTFVEYLYCTDVHNRVGVDNNGVQQMCTTELCGTLLHTGVQLYTRVQHYTSAPWYKSTVFVKRNTHLSLKEKKGPLWHGLQVPNHVKLHSIGGPQKNYK